ncbi:rhamnan synthesis F family protein [Cognatiyoonia sp. IB215182]|uniref:rhamnan synthesis F family protein n=1 Tax=Cognatiyoonia sp. IB215182 TaxID=3097353 RepID=UPI002A132506|nr:rhamnan synthesis F family protein [Cognatiyoonia sp. IB215182]MDX8354709.1 rhamnan synthesis F family protein [Cognatiyoonia sp. IB215182]
MFLDWNMIPAWKLRREVSRVAGQFRGLPSTIAELPTRLKQPARRAAYERDFDSLTRRDEGKVPFGPKLAIYLIYQPDGIAHSSLTALDWLVEHGYAPVVVANSPVHQEDERGLLARCSLLVQRPNFGYDFGGYKDGIRLIARRGISPERVIIMNDSIWMPMAPNLMNRLEERRDVDILGLIEDEKINHDHQGGQPSGLKHIESYFYMISGKAWRAPAFQNFWTDYKMTDSKPDTIKFGEIGFSRKMQQAGLVSGALTSRTLFLEHLAEQDDQFIETSLKYASYGDKDLRRQGDILRHLTTGSLGWRDMALDHVRRCINRRRFNAAFCYANDQMLGTSFMKKNQEKIFSEMRLNYLRAIQDGQLTPPADTILAEIIDIVKMQYPDFAKTSQSFDVGH